VDAETKREITFAKICEKSEKLGKGLVSQGITYGDVVAICSENNIDYFWIVLGVLRAGASCALLSPTYTAREWEHALSVSQPKVVMCSISVCETKLEQYLETSSVEKVLVWDSKGRSLPKNTMSLEDILEPTSIAQIQKREQKNLYVVTHNPSEKYEADKQQTKNLPAFILSSSGSTGLPKGVVLTHLNITTALTTSGHYTSHDDVALGVSPFCHAYGLLLALMCMCEGTRIVVVHKFKPDLFIQSIKEYQITSLYLVASLLVFLMKKDVLDKPECSSVRHIWTGAAPLSPKLQQLVLDKLAGRAVLHHSYGLTETTFTMFTCTVESCTLGTPGKVTPGMECKVIDVETGKITGPNCKGELCFRGPLIMKEYMMNVGETSKAIDSDGWLHSGDLGYYNVDGYFYIVDRLKELIKYQGYQVSPSELESILVIHPGIHDAAVIGIEDETYGELPGAFVVRDSDTHITADDIKHYVALSNYGV
ncbi:hypothetical protein Cfor_09810, partial [Coptotermes formosanus]